VNYKAGELVISFTSTHEKAGARSVIRFAHLPRTGQAAECHDGTGTTSYLAVCWATQPR